MTRRTKSLKKKVEEKVVVVDERESTPEASGGVRP